ncbi:MAG: hypothetical protein ACLFTA_01755 [Candidatus Nanohaloarchaea archaeon]
MDFNQLNWGGTSDVEYTITIDEDRVGKGVRFFLNDQDHKDAPRESEGAPAENYYYPVNPSDKWTDSSQYHEYRLVDGEIISGDESTVETVQPDQSNSYVMVNEWAINLDPSYDYSVDAEVNADYDQERQVDPEE